MWHAAMVLAMVVVPRGCWILPPILRHNWGVTVVADGRVAQGRGN